MTIPNREVLDISHHNSIDSWADIKAAGIVGVIHKATQGRSYTDPTYLKRAAPAMRATLQWGAYHFADNSDVEAQVNHFLAVVGGDNETLYALDWEDNGNSTMSFDQARQFLQLIEQKIGRNRCVLYSGNTAKEAMGSRADPYFGAHRLWLAQYSNNPVPQASWDTYWLWQYSDGNAGPEPHSCPGVTGEVDTNSWPGTDAELVAQWTGAPVPTPPPVGVPTITINVSPPGSARVIVTGAQSPLN